MKREEARAATAAACRELLLARRAELITESGHAAPGLSELGRVSEDDQAPILHDQFISLQVKWLDYETLKQVNAALDRLATGEFGVCAACGEAISPNRLAAIPWAHCCIECQERIGPARQVIEANRRAARPQLVSPSLCLTP